MSNPFVFAVMNAFRGKLPKTETEQAKDEPREAEHLSSPETSAPPPQPRED
jgi:hypothetical protein